MKGNRARLVAPLVAFPIVSALLIPSIVSGQELNAEFRQLRLDGTGIAVSDAKLSIGRTELEFASGTLYTIVAGDGSRSGFLFQGKGRYAHHVEDPFAIQALDKNVEIQVPSLGHSDRSIYDTFDRALILRALDDGALGEPIAVTVPSGASRWFDDRMEQIAREWVPYDEMIAAARLNEPRKQYAMIEFEGDHAPIVVELNEFTQEEKIGSLFQPPGTDWRAYRALASQPTADWKRSRPSFWVVDHVALAVRTADNRNGTVRSEIDLTIKRAGLRQISFALINNRTDAVTDTWVSKRRQLTVNSVLDEDGHPIPYSHRHDHLTLDFGSVVPPGSHKRVVVETSGEFFTAKYGEHGDQVVDFSDVNWYPLPTELAQSTYPFELTVRCKKPFVPISTGLTISDKQEGDENLLEARSEVPVQFVALLMGNYTNKVIETTNGTKLRIHGYGELSDRDLSVTGTLVEMMFSQLSLMLGPLSLKELDVVEDPVRYADERYGRTASGLTVLSTPQFRPYQVKIAGSRGSRGAPEFIAHEVAHQWFGARAGAKTEYDRWLVESLAEYLAGMTLQILKLDKEKAFAGAPTLGWNATYNEWDGFAPWCSDWSIEAEAGLGRSISNQYEFCLLYQRGPRIIHMLRGWLGEKGFLTVLNRFHSLHPYGFVTSDDFAKLISDLTQRDLRWFVEDWMRKPGTPKVKITTAVRAGADGKQSLSVHAVQDPKQFKRMLLPIAVTYSDKSGAMILASIDAPDSETSYPLDSVPTKVEVDPQKIDMIVTK